MPMQWTADASVHGIERVVQSILSPFHGILLHTAGPASLVLEPLLDDIVRDGRDGLGLHVLQRESTPGLLDRPLGHRCWLCRDTRTLDNGSHNNTGSHCPLRSISHIEL